MAAVGVSPLIVSGAPGAGSNVTSSDATVKLPRRSGSASIKTTSLPGALPAVCVPGLRKCSPSIVTQLRV
jgi:hypothetical protein